MSQWHYRRDTELELEAHANVDQHHGQRNQQPQAAVLFKLITDLGADKLGAYKVELGPVRNKQGQNLWRQLIVTGYRHPDQNRGIGTKILDHKLLVSCRGKLAADFIQYRSLAVFQFD